MSVATADCLHASQIDSPEQVAKEHIDRVNFAKDRDNYKKDMEAELAKERTYTRIGGRNENPAE